MSMLNIKFWNECPFWRKSSWDHICLPHKKMIYITIDCGAHNGVPQSIVTRGVEIKNQK